MQRTRRDNRRTKQQSNHKHYHNDCEDDWIDEVLKEQIIKNSDFGQVDYLNLYNALNSRFNLFKTTNGSHPKERFSQRVSPNVDFSKLSLFTIRNNLQPSPQNYEIVNSETSSVNLVFAVTRTHSRRCETIMSDMNESDLDKMQEKLASELLEVKKIKSGRSAYKIHNTSYDSRENYEKALRLLGWTDLSNSTIIKKVNELRRRIKAKQAQQ